MDVVGICNVALSHIGDTATIASIDPPDGSVQAEHCKRFYPIARDSMLEMASWNFATRRVALAMVTNPSSTWSFAYAPPANELNVLAIIAPDASDDYSESFAEADPTNPSIFPQGYIPLPGAALYTPQPFSIETDATGKQIILTNVEHAVCRYSLKVVDSTQFTPLFTLALTWHLASFLAGPIIKGDAGAKMGQACAQAMIKWEQMAEASDASERNIKVSHLVSWIAGR